MLLEQNALPGITNRLLARVVRAAAVTFEESAALFPAHRRSSPATRCGRSSFTAENEEAMTTDSPPTAARVLIFGGSQGAHAINVAMVEAAARLAAAGIRLAITHQTGERDLELVRDRVPNVPGSRPASRRSSSRCDGEMKAADVVVCRAGATTLAELAASGRPAILVPLPTATDDHQRKNAEVAGAGRRGGGDRGARA